MHAPIPGGGGTPLYGLDRYVTNGKSIKSKSKKGKK